MLYGSLKHIVCLVAISLCVYFTDNSRLTSASPFEGSRKSSKFRLPASIAKQVINFDCSQPNEAMELSTQFETVRIETKNCPTKFSFTNVKLNHNLMTFEASSGIFSSEFAYLAHGENSFLLKAGEKEYKISIHRF